VVLHIFASTDTWGSITIDSDDTEDQGEGVETMSTDDEDEHEHASTTAAIASPAKSPAATTAKPVPYLINDKPGNLDPTDEYFKAVEEYCLKLKISDNSPSSHAYRMRRSWTSSGNLALSLTRRDHRMADIIDMVRAAVDTLQKI
jgi:hypothetical protein